jgi:hypothetical protein
MRAALGASLVSGCFAEQRADQVWLSEHFRAYREPKISLDTGPHRVRSGKSPRPACSWGTSRQDWLKPHRLAAVSQRIDASARNDPLPNEWADRARKLLSAARGLGPRKDIDPERTARNGDTAK